jgi:hypothetical protein
MILKLFRGVGVKVDEGVGVGGRGVFVFLGANVGSGASVAVGVVGALAHAVKHSNITKINIAWRISIP